MDIITTEKIEKFYKNLRSSYKENRLGTVLFDEVMVNNPQKVIEFGTLDCYSTVYLGLALKELNNGGTLYSYDLYDLYKYKHGSFKKNVEIIKEFELDEIVKLGQLSIEDWMSMSDYADLYHIDISNDGEIVDNFLKSLSPSLRQICLIEGGSVERDNIEWMKKYNKSAINPIILKWGGEVIAPKFPSISKVIIK